MADVFRDVGHEYLALHPSLLPQQSKVVKAIMNCRTASLGGYIASCDVCDYTYTAYNPCRNRHCPNCQGQLAHEWVARLEKIFLPTLHFHVVFTLPTSLRDLAFENMHVLYDLLLQGAGTVLTSVAREPKYLGGQVGVTTVLHTWNREMGYHPHTHCIVTAGGLAADGTWVRPPYKQFLAPNAVLRTRFRAFVVEGLRRARKRGELRFAGATAHLAAPEAFDELCRQLFKHRWHVYTKPAFGDLGRLLRYFGRYVQRVAISDSRLLDVTEDHVCFATKDGDWIELGTLEFVGRFLRHVLPHRFVKIRHYGLYAVAVAERRELARAQLAPDHDAEDDQDDAPPGDTGPAQTESCPACFFGVLVVTELPPLDPCLPPPDT